MNSQIISGKYRLSSVSQSNDKSKILRNHFLYIFVGLRNKEQTNHMTIYRRIFTPKIVSVLIVFFLLSMTEMSYSQGWGSWDDAEQADTTEVDNAWGDDSWGGDSWGGGGGGGVKNDKGTPPKPIRPYERIIDMIPIDSITKLVCYTAVHDVESQCEECTADSLYLRAKAYLLQRFGDGKKFPKKWIVEDTENQRIILTVRLPLEIDANTHSKRKIGEYEFKFQLWVRDYAYKYKFINIVHLEPKLGSKPNDYTSIYAEHYLKVERQVRPADSVLLAIDRDMKDLIKNLVEVMKDPVTLGIDEEDF
jgi:hypothetical protein